MFYPVELWGLVTFVSIERVKGIEPSSPAWKAGALTIVLHSQGCCYLCQVIPERFERSTHALEGRCSIQLS